jgi:hypothetical protein
MPVLSYVHHLFNIDQCQAYIHTLRWDWLRVSDPTERSQVNQRIRY